MKKALALLVALLLLSAPALAEEADGDFVEAAGDGSAFTDTPESLIVSAMEIYSWFAMCPLDVDENLPGADGALYRVLDERFCSYDEMNALLATYFCDEIREALWNFSAYTVIDGFLYRKPDAPWRSMDERIEAVTYELTAESENQRTYSVTVDYADDGDDDSPETETLTYVQDLIDETWQFTEFPFFW